jgi:cell division septation protein DedD
MSRLPDNTEHQHHQKQNAHQAGEDSASQACIHDAAGAGYAAVDSGDSALFHEHASTLPFDDYPAADQGAEGGLARDRNLSGVVRTIRDEGPPGDDETGVNAENAARQDPVSPGKFVLMGAEEDHAPEREPWAGGSRQGTAEARLGGRPAIYRSLRGVLVILAIIGVVAGAGKFISSLLEETGTPGEGTQPVALSTADRAGGARIQEMQQLQQIQQIQLQINARLDELKSVIAALADDNNRRWAANSAVLAEIREQQRSEQALIASRIEALQKQLASKPVTAVAPEVSADSPEVPLKQSASQSVGDDGWAVNLASFHREAQAGELLVKLKRAGIPVEQHTTSLDGDTRYRLRVTGFATRNEAKSYVSKLDKGLGLRGPWVSRK